MTAVAYTPSNNPSAGDLSADDGAPIVNDVAFAYFSRGIYVGVGGDITLTTRRGTSLLFKSVPTGTVLPVQAQLVAGTGTTATNLIALW